jgi:multisubunit Na+/H+ antiporter MnhG subunit
MRNIIFGVIGIIWGIGILIYSAQNKDSRRGGEYGAGQTIGMIFGFLFIPAGISAIVLGIRGSGENRTKRKKAKRPTPTQ